MGVYRRGVNLSYQYVAWTSPLSRVCPACDAGAGERCWSLKPKPYPLRVNTPHAERRRRRRDPEDGLT